MRTLERRLAIFVIAAALLPTVLAFTSPVWAQAQTNPPLNIPTPEITVSQDVNAAAGVGSSVAAPPSTQISVPFETLTNATVAAVVNDVKFIDVPWIAQYVGGAYNYAVSIAAVLAAVMMMIGGLQYLTAGGDPSKVSRAKSRISDAVLGLVLVFGSYLLLYAINPTLTAGSVLLVPKVEQTVFVANETPEYLVDESTPTAATAQSNPAGTKTPPTQGSSVPSLKQYDFKNVGYINSNSPKCITQGNAGKKPYTIASSGCGVTSAAMVVGYYHPEITPSTLPPAMAELATNNNMRTCSNGCKSCSGTAGAFFTSASTVGTYGLKGEQVTLSKALSLLRQGKPIVALYGKPSMFTCGGHYIVFAGMDGSGNVIVNDPGHPDWKPYTDDNCDNPQPTSVYPKSVPTKWLYGGFRAAWYIHP